jgi:cobalamin biosynthesis protein CbiM
MGVRTGADFGGAVGPTGRSRVHVPDGFIDAQTSVAAGGVALVGVAASLHGARRELDERTAPLAGLVAAFVFSVQMLNFPVGAGTSGHLMGGALAAVLIGPWTGAMAVAVVLGVQALLFADGGLSALGINIILMSLVTALLGYAGFRLLMRVLPSRLSSVPLAAGLAAFVSVPVAATAFVGIYSIGGTSDVSIGAVASAMIGVHLLIGVGEGVITALTVGSVLAVRPDLVYGARGLLPKQQLELRPSSIVVPEQRSELRRSSTEAEARR